MNIERSVVVVTGANRGLGRSFVDVLLEMGVKRVYAGARDPAGMVASERVVPLALDVTNERSLEAAAARASDATMLINNAGVLASYGVLDLTREALQRDLDVNAFGLLSTTRAFLPALERAGGAVVNVLSVASIASVTPLGGYSAAKAAAYSLSQALRVELQKKGVTVHAALPGGIDTDMVRGLEIPKTSPRDVARGILEGVVRGDAEIYPDPQSRGLFAVWQRDPRAAAKQLNGE